MVAMLRRDRERYPELIQFLGNQFQSVPEKPSIWQSFLDTTGLGSEHATQLIRLRTRPYIIAVPILNAKHDGNHIGAQVRSDFPETIQLNIDVAQHFQQHPNDPCVKLYLEALVLHELVHVVDFRNGLFESPTERGADFERKAYGRVVTGLGMDWICRREIDQDINELMRDFPEVI